MTVSSRPSTSKRIAVLVAASLLIGGGFWWLLRRGALPLLPSADALASVRPATVVLFSGAWLTALALKAARWHFQLAAIGKVPLKRVFAASLVGQAALLLLPLRSGELVRPALISRRSPISFLAAMSTSAAERIADSLFASVLLILALATSTLRTPLPDRIGDLPVPAALVPGLGYSAATVTVIACALVLSFFYFRAPTLRLIRRTLGRFSTGFADWLAEKLEELSRGLEFLASPSKSLAFLGVTGLYWIAHLLGTYLLFAQTTFPELTLAQAGVMLGTMAFGMSIPNAPGFFGVFQVSVYASLAVFYSPERIQQDGTLPIFLLYVLELGWILALAPFAFWLERRATGAQAAAEPPAS